MNILHVSLQIALLVEDLVADGAGEVVTLRVDGVDVTVQVCSAGYTSEDLVT